MCGVVWALRFPLRSATTERSERLVPSRLVSYRRRRRRRRLVRRAAPRRDAPPLVSFSFSLARSLARSLPEPDDVRNDGCGCVRRPREAGGKALGWGGSVRG